MGHRDGGPTLKLSTQAQAARVTWTSQQCRCSVDRVDLQIDKTLVEGPLLVYEKQGCDLARTLGLCVSSRASTETDGS